MTHWFLRALDWPLLLFRELATFVGVIFMLPVIVVVHILAALDGVLERRDWQ